MCVCVCVCVCAGLDWDKKSALAFFGPGGPPPYNIYIYDIHYHSKVFEQ